MKFIGRKPDRMALKLQQLQTQYQGAACVHAMARLGIADAIRDEPKTTAEIARALEASEYGVERLLRALAGLELLERAQGGRWALTPLSDWLRSDRSNSLLPGVWVANNNYRFLADLDQAVKRGGPVGKNLYETLYQHPDGPRMFRDSIAVRANWEYASLADAFDFSRFRRLVDIGGGSGRLAKAVLEQSPELKAVLFDLPEVMDLSRRQVAEWGLADRIECVGGSYFDDIPAGGDLYVIAEILYDWTDDKVGQILRRCHERMAPGATLLIVEVMLDEENVATPLLLYNVMVMTFNGGGLRTPSEHRRLLEESGFEVLDHRSTGGLNTSLIEARRR